MRGDEKFNHKNLQLKTKNRAHPVLHSGTSPPSGECRPPPPEVARTTSGFVGILKRVITSKRKHPQRNNLPNHPHPVINDPDVIRGEHCAATRAASAGSKLHLRLKCWGGNAIYVCVRAFCPRPRLIYDDRCFGMVEKTENPEKLFGRSGPPKVAPPICRNRCGARKSISIVSSSVSTPEILVKSRRCKHCETCFLARKLATIALVFCPAGTFEGPGRVPAGRVRHRKHGQITSEK